MLVTKYPENKIFYHIDVDSWGGTLASIARAIRASCHYSVMATPGQVVFGIDVIFNLTSIVDYRVLTTVNQQQTCIDNFQEKSGKSNMTTQKVIKFM